MTEIEKDKAIKKEMTKLKGTLKNIPKDKIKMAEGLISNAAFMAVTLQELKQEINERGAITTYNKNPVENPATKSYNTMINRYSSIMSQLLALLPKEEQPDAAKQIDPKEEQLKQFIQKASDGK